MRGVKYPSVGLALFCVATPGLSLEKGISGGLSTEWTDNVYLTANDRRNDVLETLNLGANLADQESLYQYGLDYIVDYERYERESYDATTSYNGTAFLNLSFLPRRFEWYSAVQSETTLVQSSSADTPDNRDQRDMFMTSPRLTVISLPRDTVTLAAEAEKVVFRESDQSDSDRLGGDLTWVHALSPLLDLNAKASQQQVDFDVASDYDTTNYQVGFTRRINGGSISVAAGKTTIEPETGEKFDGAQYQADANWSSEPHSLTFQAYRDLTDTSVGLAGEVETTGQVTPADIETGDVTLVTRTHYLAGYGYGFTGSFSINTNLYFDEEQAEDDSTDVIRKGIGLIASRELSPEMRASFEFDFERYDSTDIDAIPVEQVDYTRRYIISFERDFYERLRANVWLRREESNRELDVASYEQHAVGAGLQVTF